VSDTPAWLSHVQTPSEQEFWVLDQRLSKSMEEAERRAAELLAHPPRSTIETVVVNGEESDSE
jgi:hypothetical protein